MPPLFLELVLRVTFNYGTHSLESPSGCHITKIHGALVPTGLYLAVSSLRWLLQSQASLVIRQDLQRSNLKEHILLNAPEHKTFREPETKNEGKGLIQKGKLNIFTYIISGRKAIS